MSEQIIIIRKSDLEKNRVKIEETIFNEKDEEKVEDYTHLAHALQTDTILFPEIELVVLKVSIPTLNRRVITVLDKLKIDYRIKN